MECLRNTNKNSLLIFITIFSIFSSCSSLKNQSYTLIGCKDIPIQALNISINDYHKKLLKQKESLIAAVRVNVYYTSAGWYYISMTPWISDEDKYSLDLLYENVGKIPAYSIPNEYVKKDDVLYVWHNPQTILTKDFILTLMKYNLVRYHSEDEIVTTDGKRTCYMFCDSKSNKKFYRKETSYNPSLPHCKCR